MSRGDGEIFLSKHSKIQKSPRSGLGPKSAQMGGDSSDALELRENRSSPVRKERNQNREDFFQAKSKFIGGSQNEIKIDSNFTFL